MNAQAPAGRAISPLRLSAQRRNIARVNSATPLADPIPAVLGERAFAAVRRARLSDSPSRLLLLVALPYWIAVSIVRLISSELFRSGGAAAFNSRALGLSVETQAVQYVLMLIVVIAAYRVALRIGWPDERRWLAAAKHIGLALAVAVVSRPVFVLGMELVWDVRVDWFRVFAPPVRGLKLWTSMALEFLLPYFFGLALLAGVQVLTALQRSELERAELRNAWTQARLHALRMQLNPHFLFNTFNTIAMLLDANPQPARARTLVLALSDLYRRTLVAAEREWTSIGEELALAEDYLRIQAARFDGRLTYRIDCSSHLTREQAPALLLQPLIENAVLHGAADDRQHLRVWIRIERRGSASGESLVYIEVGNETNGALGLSRGVGVGLRNTQTRLSACYSGRAQMDARALTTGRFVATLTLPCGGETRAPQIASQAPA